MESKIFTYIKLLGTHRHFTFIVYLLTSTYQKHFPFFHYIICHFRPIIIVISPISPFLFHILYVYETFGSIYMCIFMWFSNKGEHPSYSYDICYDMLSKRIKNTKYCSKMSLVNVSCDFFFLTWHLFYWWLRQKVKNSRKFGVCYFFIRMNEFLKGMIQFFCSFILRIVLSGYSLWTINWFCC